MKGIFIDGKGGKLSSIVEGDFLFFSDREAELVSGVKDNGVYVQRILLNTSLKSRDALPYIQRSVFYEVGGDGILSPVAGGEIIESVPCKKDLRMLAFEKYVRECVESNR